MSKSYNVERTINQHEFRRLVQIDRALLAQFIRYSLKDKLEQVDLIELEKRIMSKEIIHFEDKPFRTAEEFDNRAVGYCEFLNDVKGTSS